MAKLCNEQYHCDFSTHGPFRERVQTSTSSPLATLDWVDSIDKVACVKNWYNKKCHCEGHPNTPCGNTKGALVYNIPNRFSEGSLPLGQNPYPTKPGERIFSERKWQTQVPKSEVQQLLNYEVDSSNKINRRKKIIRNVGIGAGIVAAIAGIFALTKKKKEPTYISSNKRQRTKEDGTIEIIDNNTGKITTYPNSLMYNQGVKSDNTALYVVLGVGVVALSVIIIRR